MTDGHRVRVRIRLLSTTDGGLKGPIEAGHRSVAYRFVDHDNPGKSPAFGALVEKVEAGGQPGTELVADISFYHPEAKEYATSGAEFDLWNGRVVGQGQVLVELPSIADGD